MSMRLVQQMMDDVRNRVRLTIGRAVLSVISDSKAIQTAQAQLLAGETQDDAERIQEYGFTSVPLGGAEAVLVFVGGQRDHGLIIATDDRRYRPKGLVGGEVALYTDEDISGGHRVHLKRNKEVEIISDVTASMLQTPTKTTVSNDTEIELVSGTANIVIKPAKITVNNATEIELISGATEVSVTPSAVTLTVGSQVLLLNASGLFHNGKNIGSTHVHVDTMPNNNTTSGMPQ